MSFVQTKLKNDRYCRLTPIAIEKDDNDERVTMNLLAVIVIGQFVRDNHIISKILFFGAVYCFACILRKSINNDSLNGYSVE